MSWVYATAIALLAALAFAVLPGDGRGQIQLTDPGFGVTGVFAVSIEENGAGTVVQLPEPQPSVHGGPINCHKSEGKKSPSTGLCAVEVDLHDPSGDVIGLGAVPDAGSEFVGWVVYPEGTPTYRCDVEPVCYVLLKDKAVAFAVFVRSSRPPASPPPVPLTVTRQGPDAESGSVTSAPTGIACIPGGGASCSTSFPLGSTVTLAATPGPSGTFGGWRGACAGAATSSTCTLTMGAPTAVSADFNIATQQLTAVVQGPANSGGVSSDVQPGISCPRTCTGAFAQNSEVTLTPTPTSGFAFSGWSGAGCSGTSTCVVQIGSQTASVTASFAALAVKANLKSAKVVLIGPRYKTRQVQVVVRANEPVNILVRVRRGNVTIASKTYKAFGPDTALGTFDLRQSVPAGRAQVQATFTNVAGTSKVQTKNVVIPK